MADNIRKQDFFSVKEVAWHGKGKVLENCPTSEEAIKIAGLDYTVGLAPLAAQIILINKDNALTEPTVIKNANQYYKAKMVKDKFQTYRTDTNELFGTVGGRYTIVQNINAFDFFDNIIGAKEAIFETAGALGNGETIFITAKLPHSFTVKGKDVMDEYLVLTNSHDGTGSIIAYFTTVRVVCWNTLMMSLNQTTNKVTFRHTASVHDRMKNAETLLGISRKSFVIYEEFFNQAARIKVNETLMGSLVDQLFVDDKILAEIQKDAGLRKELVSTKAQNKIDLIKDLIYNEPTQQFDHCKDTLYGFINGVTLYTNHYSKSEFDDFFGGSVERLNKKVLDISQKLITL